MDYDLTPKVKVEVYYENPLHLLILMSKHDSVSAADRAIHGHMPTTGTSQATSTDELVTAPLCFFPMSASVPFPETSLFTLTQNQCFLTVNGVLGFGYPGLKIPN